MANKSSKTETAEKTVPVAPASANDTSAMWAAAGLDIPDIDTWEKEQVGFAPYWSPEQGKAFYAAPVARDERDPEFVRYLMVAGIDTMCASGPVEEQESVLVKKGDYFTVSVYYTLESLFNEYLQCSLDQGEPLYVAIMATKKVKTSTPGQSVWKFEARVNPDTKKKIEAFRLETRKAKALEAAERKALQEADTAAAE